MKREREQLYTWAKEHLEKAAGKKGIARHLLSLDLSGPSTQVVQGQDGNPFIGIGWCLGVGISHDVIVGAPGPEYSVIPLITPLPLKEHIEQAVDMCLEDAFRNKMTVQNPSQQEMDAELPPGLRGKSLRVDGR